MKLDSALHQLAQEIAVVRGRIFMERFARAALPLGLALCAWASFALFGLHERLPLLAQSASAAAALAFFVWMFSNARRAFRRPTTAEARARLAVESRLDPGAFEALGDQPSRYDPSSLALWKREQDFARARARKARAGPMRVMLDDIDRYKMRFVAPVVLVVSLALAGDLASQRLAAAFLPDPGPLLGDRAMQVEAWAMPADYTHAGPISLSERMGERVETPPSIEVTVRLTGPTGAPRLVFERRGENREARFVRAADGAWEARLAIPGPGRLKIVRFHTRGSWRLAPTPDAAPQALMAAPIAALPGERAGFGWSASDDFGIERMALRVRLVDPPAGARGPVDLAFDSPAGAPKDAQGDSELEIATHPFAGMEVYASVVAFDALGQAGESAAMRFTMPEKVFLRPLARAAIEIRRQIHLERRPYREAKLERRRTIPAGDILLGNQRIEIRNLDEPPPLDRAPAGMHRAAQLISSLTMESGDGYFTDMAVLMGFASAQSRLKHAENSEETEAAAEMLWQTALRAEYGGAADARAELEAAQEMLAQALRENAPKDRIDALIEATQRAMENYLRSLVQEAAREGRMETAEDTAEQAQITERDMQQMLEDVQRLNEQGRHEEAQRLLQELNEILSNLDVSLEEAEAQQQEEGERSEEMQAAMDQLSEAMGEQQELRDDTQQREGEEQQRQSEGGGSGGEQEGGAGGQDLAERQQQLQQALEAAQENMQGQGAAPSDDLNEAGQAMQDAENALRQSEFARARGAQDSALDSMRRGAEGLASLMRQMEGQQQGQQGRAAGQSSAGRDPLGRPLTNAGNGEGEADVPTQIDPVRAREITDEIRRRAQDPNRPEAEREYLRRLLDRFSDN